MSLSRVLFALALLLAPRGAVAAEVSYRDTLVLRARDARLASDQGWIKLLHYRPAGSGWRSEADGAKFFLAQNGRTDPAAELDADVTAFFVPQPDKGQHPQCLFPARYHWLKEKLAFDPELLPVRSCPDFDAWRDAIDADAISVVYASAFLNNPASMAGHTFLRLHRKGGSDALLDYTINYAATPDTGNALMYTLKGLNGSFKGEYSLLPFYMKTQEYGHLEMRDLWDYRLNLTQAQIDLLVMHGWEMGSTHFNYYFFTKNCSYQMLTFLEAAIDTGDVSASFRGFVVPGDTIRALQARPGLVEPAQYRPSYVTEIVARRARLSEEELATATTLGRKVTEEGLKGLEDFEKHRRALILEAAQDYLRYRNGFTYNQSTATLQGEHSLLIARGRLGLPSVAAAPLPPKPLEAGHETARVGLGGGFTKSAGFEEVSFRAALHDLAAADDGYIPDSHLEFGALNLRFDNRDRELYIERLDLVSIVSLSPWDPWIKKPSWKFSTGVSQAKELGCSGASCMYYGLNVGAGLSALTHLGRRELYYAMAETDFGFGPVIAQDWRAGAGGSVGVMVDITARWRVLGEATYIDYAQRSAPRQRLRLTNSLRFTRDTELRLSFDRRTPNQEASAMFYLYF